MTPRVTFVHRVARDILAVVVLGLSSLLTFPLAAKPRAENRHPAGYAAPSRQAIEAEVARIAQTVGGEVGVYAIHLEKGITVSVNANDAFPMASTFKVAVAGAALAQVDAGHLALNGLIPVEAADKVSSEGIAEIFPFDGVSVSIRNLIDTMLVRSDNTATDVLMRALGGPERVMTWVTGLGVQHMQIDGDTKHIIARFFGRSLPPGMSIDQAIAANPALLRMSEQPNQEFDDDPRDTVAPEAMADLLSQIVEGHALSSSSTEIILDAMKRDSTGRNRLRAMLPPNTVVADKTGTIGGTVNDVGLVELPNGLGRVVIAVYIKKSGSDQREKVIAQIGRCIYDYMLTESARVGATLQ
jgi:beta-lactamase class A